MEELTKVRRLPEQAERVETGPVMFGEDWPGLFVRGDDCFFYEAHLKMVLEGLLELAPKCPDRALDMAIAHGVVSGLLSDLASSNARANDAYPAWQERDE